MNRDNIYELIVFDNQTKEYKTKIKLSANDVVTIRNNDLSSKFARIPKIIRFSSDICKEDLSFFYNFYNVSVYPHLLDTKEHYRLLLMLTKSMNHARILDAGTNIGASAVTLAQNNTNMIYTVDIGDTTTLQIGSIPNICVMRFDVLSLNKGIIKGSDLILLDIDPHDGEAESKFLKKLEDDKFSGILVCDDIHLNQGMEDFWNSITKKKLDVTEYGHHTGTGIVDFSERIEFIKE